MLRCSEAAVFSIVEIVDALKCLFCLSSGTELTAVPPVVIHGSGAIVENRNTIILMNYRFVREGHE